MREQTPAGSRRSVAKVSRAPRFHVVPVADGGLEPHGMVGDGGAASRGTRGRTGRRHRRRRRTSSLLTRKRTPSGTPTAPAKAPAPVRGRPPRFSTRIRSASRGATMARIRSRHGWRAAWDRAGRPVALTEGWGSDRRTPGGGRLRGRLLMAADCSLDERFCPLGFALGAVATYAVGHPSGRYPWHEPTRRLLRGTARAPSSSPSWRTPSSTDSCTALISSTFVVPFYFALGTPVAYAWLAMVLLAARWGWKRGARSIAVKAEREALKAAGRPAAS